jgi:hypothetical protein
LLGRADGLVVDIGEIGGLPDGEPFLVLRRTSRLTNVRKLPMCPRAYTVRPHVYMRTVLPSAGTNFSSERVSVL